MCKLGIYSTLISITCTLLCSVSSEAIASNNVVQIGRYTSVSISPTKPEINPLLAVSVFNFPPSVYSVGEAINQVLATTGYKLSTHISPQVEKTLNKSLPITDRKLGPMTIQSALKVLVGYEVYELQRDPLNRLVNFKIKPSIARALGVKKHG